MNVTEWIAELAAAKKREKDFRTEGQEILDIYSTEKPVAFNILFSNTETLLPSLYSDTPRPVVERRFKDDDIIGKAASEAGKRVLEFLIDTNIEGYETFDEAVKCAVLDGLLPGRGVTHVKYDADIVGDDTAEEENAYKEGELVCIESRKWNRFLHGYATKWSKVPWIAFGEDIDKNEATRLFGKKVASALQYTNEEHEEGEKDKKDQDAEGERETTPIWVIWNKSDRKVIFLSEHYKDGFLKEPVDDPLGVTGFFPIPRPIIFVAKSNDLEVTPLYSLYKEQAEELYSVSRRIIRLISACKARGIYDSELGTDIENIMSAEENELIPADKSSSLAAEKGLGNAIWFMPIEAIVNALRELAIEREGAKAVIWEIMGIADIMRGQSAASETLGAQQIKQAWGSLRLKRMQKEVMRYCRDLLRIMLEIAANKFSTETWVKMTGLPFLTDEQFEQAQAQMQQASQQMQMLQMQQQQPMPIGPPGGPPQGASQQPPPQLQQQMQQIQQMGQKAQAELQKPKWSDVLAVLKDDVQRSYRIDIETNSTVAPEAAEDQKNIAELMNAIGQFLAGVNPLIEQGIMPFEAAQAMLLAIVKRYRFGTEIEDQIKAMKQPPPKDDGKQAELQSKMQMHQQGIQAEMQKHQMSLESQQQVEQQAAQSKMQEMIQAGELEKAKAQTQVALEQAKLEADMQLKAQELEMNRRAQQSQSRIDQETELKKVALQGAVQIEVARIGAAAQEGPVETEEEGMSAKAIERILETQEALLKLIAAPVKHIRGADGKIEQSVRAA